MARVSVRHKGTVLRADGSDTSGIEILAGEEPLEIRLDGEPFVVTMRTPGSDFELAAGYLVSEGLITRAEQIESIRYARSPQISDRNRFNVVDVALSDEARGAAHDLARLARRVVTTSACGVCGTTSIDQVSRPSRFGPDGGRWRLDPDVLRALPDRLRAAQTLFEHTGGVHAAGLFDTDGQLECVREDVGRHNAVDKLVGSALLDDRLPLRERILQVSGRASFELVQKAAMAGIGVLAAVSAPSSLAAELAAESGIMLAGFSRGDRVTIYTHPERVAS